MAGKGVEAVRLEGEAYFEVPHDPDREFVVETPAGVVRDLGTSFNVRARDDEVAVVVSEGLVALESAGQVVEVRAGEGARALRGLAPEAAGHADVRAALAWTTGRLVFIDRELEDIAAELTRRFGKTVSVAPDIRDARITAAVSAESGVEDAVHVVALAAGVRYQLTSTGWMFTSE
jgi:transmembrane sensor